MFSGELLDALGDLVVALREDDGRGHGFGVVFQCDGDVGWVGDDDVGLGDFLHHASLRHLALDLADLGFDQWVAFGLFEFFFHFLLGHHQILVLLVALIKEIDRRNDCQDQGQLQAEMEDHGRFMREPGGDVAVDVAEAWDVMGEDHPRDANQDQQLEHIGDETHQAAQPEQSSEAGDGADAIQLWNESLAREVQPHLTQA